MMDFIGNFIDNHPLISSIIGAIVIYLGIVVVIGFIYFLLWLHSVSEIASVIIILFPLLVICVRAMISS